MSASLRMLKKLRGRLLCRTTGAPVAGVVVNLLVATNETSRIPISTLKSDSTGYFSFDLQTLINAGLDTVFGLYISAPQVGLRDHNLLRTLLASTSDEQVKVIRNNDLESEGFQGQKSLCIEFPIYVETSNVCGDVDNAGCQTANIPSIQSPDECDYTLSPYSFVTSAKFNLGEDCCESLVPSTLPIQEHLFYRVIVRREGEGDLDTVDPSIERSVDITGKLNEPPARIKFADVLDYRQRWHAIGHSLGEIKYSLPLAPGESTQLAVIEWSRNDVASRFDSASAKENLFHWQNRDRTIEETIDAGLKESQGGWSWAGGLSSGMAYDAKEYGKYTGNWAAGGGTSNSWGNRDLEAESLQELHDTIMQSTSYTRSLNSTVIVQASQTEMNNIRTRRVANHNHCHALTVQYYEVLRHFRLCTEFVGKRHAVLIPFSPVSLGVRGIAIRYRTILEQALLDQSLLPFFDALVRLGLDLYPDQTEEPGNVTEPTYFTGELSEIEVDAQLFPVYPKTEQGTEVLIEKGSTVHISAKAQEGGIAFPVSGIPTPRYDLDGQHGNAAPHNQGWPMPGAPSFAFLAKIGPDFYFIGRTETITAKNTGTLSLWFNDGMPSDNDGKATADIRVTAPTKVEPPDKEKVPISSLSPRDADKMREAFLLNHLNTNLGYYNRAVWFLMDPVERQMYLEMALGFDNALLAAIDSKPIAVSGNYVAFVYDGPMPSMADDDVVKLEPRESIVTLPTRGLFAEAQLGHCTSCEQRDVTRMWDWTEMTTEEPPGITGIQPGPQGQIPNITPSQLPSSVIQIAPAPTAPDPAGLAAALTLLGTSNVFRDMSGLDEASELLGKLVDGTTTTLEAMVKGASQAKEKVDAARTGQSPSPAGSGSQGNGNSGPSAKDLADRFSLLPEIKNFAKELGLDQMQTKDFALDQIYGTKRQPSKSTGGLRTGEPPKSIFEVVFRAFIPSPAVPAVSPFALLVGPVLAPGTVTIGFSGDDRDVSYAGQTYRAEIIARVTTDALRGPLVEPPILHFGESVQWDSNQLEYEMGMPWWWFKVRPGEISNKRHTVVRTPENLAAQVTRDANDPDLIHIRLTIAARIAADDPIIAAMAPEINADLVLSIWEKAGYTPQFSVEGTHDGFPGFELFINGKTLHSYNPRNIAGLGPAALFGRSDRQPIWKRNEVIPGVVPGH